MPKTRTKTPWTKSKDRRLCPVVFAKVTIGPPAVPTRTPWVRCRRSWQNNLAFPLLTRTSLQALVRPLLQDIPSLSGSWEGCSWCSDVCFSLSSRTRTCAASTEQDWEICAPEPERWRNSQRGIYATQPQRCVQVFFWACLRLFPQRWSPRVCLHPTADDNATIRVTNLSEDTREADLQELFRPFGAISRIYLAKDKNTGQSKVGAGLNTDLRKLSARRYGNGFLLFLVGVCFHQFPSSRGCIQSHRWSVRIWIWSPHSQCWMGQVRLVSLFNSCCLFMFTTFFFFLLFRPSNNWRIQ